jgi:hypothetical protein
LSGRSARAEAVSQALIEICHSRSLIEREHFEIRGRFGIVPGGPQDNLAAPGVLQQVGARFGDDDGNLLSSRFIESDSLRQSARDPASLGRPARILNYNSNRLGHVTSISKLKL